MSRVDNTGGSGFTTDNGTGLVVRTKLNQIVAALSTLNQGSGDPTIGVAAYVPHIDGNTLKIRNAANDAFVTLGDVSATNFGHAGLSAANTFTSTNIFQEDVTFTGASANIVFDKSADDLIFNDNAKAVFGTSSDGLEIFHDASDSIINDNGTGSLKLQLGGSTKAEIVSGGLTVTGTLTATTLAGTLSTAAQTNITSVGTLTGLTLSGDMTFTGDSANVVFDKSDSALEFADNAEARFGTGDDLKIYHDGSNSYIKDTGTGNLRIWSDDLRIQDTSGNSGIQMIEGGAVNLYHSGTKKFETASGGVSLTGGAAANVTSLSDGATITIDMATACHHSVTLGGNRTFAAPSNQVVGQSGSIFIQQDGTGSRTVSFNSAFKFVGGTAPTLTTGAGLLDRIDYIIFANNVIHCAVSLDVK